MSGEISGKIARVLSNQDVVLNRGQQHGISVGDYVGVIDDDDSIVENPEDGTEIGGLVSFKVSLRVTQVSESLSIASTYRVQQVNRGGLGLGTAPNLGAISEKYLREPEWVEQIERMRVSPGVAGSLGGTGSTVAVGDHFRVVPKNVADAGYALV